MNISKTIRRWILCLAVATSGYILFDGLHIILFFSLYFTIYSPTERFTDELSPVISMVIITQTIIKFNIISNVILLPIIYILLYFITMTIITIITPRYKINDHQQPSDTVIIYTKKTKLGLTYYLEKHSPSTELLNSLTKIGDDIADDLWPDLLKLLPKSKNGNDPVEVLLANVDKNPKFKKFIDHVSTIPKWCNFNELSIGQKLHQRLSLPFAYVLGICTLVGGFGCSEINKVLISSRYWAHDNNRKSLLNTLNRLRETSVWLYTVMQDTNTLKPGGLAWKSILRVRLFHCKIRYQLRLKSFEKDNQQVPINQCHLIGTLLGFQYNPLAILRLVIGIPISDTECHCYTQLWRYIGFILGCIEYEKKDNEECIPLKTFDMSRAWVAAIWDNLINPDIDKNAESTTLMLSGHVLKAIAMPVSESKFGRFFSINLQTIEAFFRALLNEEYADMIGLESIHWSYELQIRVIIAFIRINHIILYLLNANWFNSIIWKMIWTRVVRYLAVEILEKKEGYNCRFTQYCVFAK